MMVWMPSRGCVSSLGEAKVIPLSEPESYGWNWTILLSTNAPFSSRFKFLIATNQSGLGAIIEARLTYGCELLISKVVVIVSGEGLTRVSALIKYSPPPASIIV